MNKFTLSLGRIYKEDGNKNVLENGYPYLSHGKTKDIYYFFHEIIQENEVDPGTEEITQVEACYAYMVSIDANSTIEAVINSAVKKAYGLKSDSEYISFLNEVIAKNYDSISDPDVLEYLSFVKKLKNELASFGIIKKEVVSNNISSVQILGLMKEIISNDTSVLSDEQAANNKYLLKPFESFIGKPMKNGTKFTYGDKIYKAIKDLDSVVSTWIPGIATLSIYNEVTLNAGTKKDPIPYSESGMALTKGLYYTSNGKMYLCVRDCPATLVPITALKILMFVQEVK